MKLKNETLMLALKSLAPILRRYTNHQTNLI